MITAHRPFHRLPGYVLNGIAVALGIACVQALVGALAGPHAAQLALSGAIGASLADVPNTASRTWRRVSAAAVLSFLAALVAALLKPHPLALGVGVALVTFVAMMSMAWGARAGAVSFAPILSLVFSMAVPVDSQPALVLAGWNAVGSVLYLAWALGAALLLQRRYRAFALVGALRAAARLLKSRAALIEAPTLSEADGVAMQAWIAGEAELADKLQAARDFVFAAEDSPRARRDTAILLRTIELRDVLLASRLDLELLGRDTPGLRLLAQVAAALRASGSALDEAAEALRDGRAPNAAMLNAPHEPPPFDEFHFAAGDPRGRLLPALQGRVRSIAADVVRIQALLRGDSEPTTLNRSDLQRFVAPEGWPLAALRTQFTLQSPVLRHAVRAGLALSSAYFIALALPWASHPHWLVLSVAVVLRGNLEQTLSRRNARVLGTMLGCAVVLALSHLTSRPVLGIVFLFSVGIAHAFVLQRYWLTATAATVMALLQSHMVDPLHGFAIPERVADTLLGAALAWAFSYVLPSWERRNLPRAVDRVLKALGDYASLALHPPAAEAAGIEAIEQRLARRRAYDALGDLATALQRSAAEPSAVQLPTPKVAALLDHGQRLMAHLSMVRLTLARRAAQGLDQAAEAPLAHAASTLAACLDLQSGGPPEDQAMVRVAEGLALLPPQAPNDNALPWLLRRLQLLALDARAIRVAALRVLAPERAG